MIETLAKHQLRPPAGAHRRRVTDNQLRRPGGATSGICGLYSYQTRAAAKRHAKTLPHNTGMRARAYPCRSGCGGWHVGYLPQLVIAGIVTVAEWYGHHGATPMRDILIPLLEHVRASTGGELTFERRRVEPVDGDPYDLWGAMIETRGTVTIARDYDDPIEATAAALAEIAAHTETEATAA